jgi:hypothetical protein
MEIGRDGYWSCIICDFGVATIVDEDLLRVSAYRMSRARGISVAYAPPEILIQQFPVRPEDQKACDVFSFGMTLFEMLARVIPWLELQRNGMIEDLISRVTNGERPKFPEHILHHRKSDALLDQLVDIVERCWSHRPNNRPAINILHRQISTAFQLIE